MTNEQIIKALRTGNVESAEFLEAFVDGKPSELEQLRAELAKKEQQLAALREENERLNGKHEPAACCPIARTELLSIIAELKGGSNWLSGKHNIYSYNRAPKIAADVLSALVDVGPYELIEQLKDAHAWRLEGFGHFKDVTTKQNDAPFKAAKVLEQLFHHSPSELAAAQAENLRLIGIIKSWHDLSANVSFASEYCCCGESMDNHPSLMSCGHSPRDYGDYCAAEMVEKTEKALSSPPSDLSALRNVVADALVKHGADVCKWVSNHVDGKAPACAVADACVGAIAARAEQIRSGEVEL